MSRQPAAPRRGRSGHPSWYGDRTYRAIEVLPLEWHGGRPSVVPG